MKCPKCGGELSKHNGTLICRRCRIQFTQNDSEIDTIKCDKCGTFHFNEVECDCRLIKDENNNSFKEDGKTDSNRENV